MREKKDKVPGERRGMYLRIPILLYEKLCRMSAERTAKGTPTSMNTVVCDIIEAAPEKSQA
jgi:hypothetical protein